MENTGGIKVLEADDYFKILGKVHSSRVLRALNLIKRRRTFKKIGSSFVGKNPTTRNKLHVSHCRVI